MSARLTLLTETDVSEWTGIPVNTLRYWRQRRRGIPFIQISARTVRYDEEAVSHYLKSIEVQITSETKKPAVAAAGVNKNP